MEQGYQVSEAARNLGINPGMLGRWKCQLEVKADDAFPGNGKQSGLNEQLRKLEAENRQLRMERDILKGEDLFRQGFEMRYAFIQMHKKTWPITVQCETLKVSRSGYYAWIKRPESARGGRGSITDSSDQGNP